MVDFAITDAIPYLFASSEKPDQASKEEEKSPQKSTSRKSAKLVPSKKGKSSKKHNGSKEKKTKSSLPDFKYIEQAKSVVDETLYKSKIIVLARIIAGVFFCVSVLQPSYVDFEKYSHKMAKRMSHPSIMFKARLNNGKTTNFPASVFVFLK